jgi:phosphatidylglycerophosphatase A
VKDRPEEAGTQAEPLGSVARKAPVATLVATFFGVGFLRPASGTWGSLATLPVAWLVARAAGAPGLFLMAALATGAGIPAAGRFAALRRRGDPSQVVIDEVAGQTVTLCVVAFALARLHPIALPLSSTFTAFFLFRLFDVWKPGPVRRLEALPGGLGIVADDLLAGLFAGLVAGAGALALPFAR